MTFCCGRGEGEHWVQGTCEMIVSWGRERGSAGDRRESWPRGTNDSPIWETEDAGSLLTDEMRLVHILKE